MKTNIDSSKLLRIFRAVAGPVASRNVAKAIAIIQNGGKMPDMVKPDEIRTYFRVKARLKEHRLI